MTRKSVIQAVCSVAVMGALLLPGGTALLAQSGLSPRPQVREAIAFSVSAPLRELARMPAPPTFALQDTGPVRHIARASSGQVVDVTERGANGSGSNYSVGVNVMGLGYGFPGFTVSNSVPDSNIAVGDTQIVQWVNASYAVFDKTGSALTAAIAGNQIWQNLGGACAQYNSGKPIVQWDVAARRWFFSQNVLTGPPFYTCIAVSSSSDALGTYYLYQFPLGNGYPDLPKWGTWTNGYYQSQYNFGTDGKTPIGELPCVYDRSKMLTGDNSAGQVCFQLAIMDFGLLPGDIDSHVQPPAGQNELLFSLANSSNFAMYEISIDWSNPSNAQIFGGNESQLFAVPAFTPACNGQFLGNCVAQLNSTQLLKVLGDRLLYRLVYYDDPPLVSVRATPPKPLPSQHWLVVHDVTASGGNQAERWYEIKAKQRISHYTDLTLFQSSTYAPDSTVNRWMGSIARDKQSNILMGYSVSNRQIYPGIAIAGRLLGDPVNTMEPEVTVLEGTGSEQGDAYDSWGYYTSMRLDPVDGCTFWYTNEYYTLTGYQEWSTQIASARFNTCE